MKKICLAVSASMLAIAAPAVAHEEKPTTATPSSTIGVPKVPQHSGGTDANGCHTNHKTGDYHCHNPKK